MTDRGTDFGDPDFEPTDEQLELLSREAFAEVDARNREALTKLRCEIARLRAQALARLFPPSSRDNEST